MLRYVRLRRRQRLAIWLVVLAALIVAVPTLLSLPRPAFLGGGPSHFYLIGPTDINVDQTFPLELHLSSGGRSVNAVGIVLTFNPRYLEVTNMTTVESFCSFYTENSFDNIKGEIHISCGAPSPGFRGDSSLLLINMRGKNLGQTVINTKSQGAQILANDGKGTNLLGGSLPSIHLTIKQSI
jgi:hypothetical protein